MNRKIVSSVVMSFFSLVVVLVVSMQTGCNMVRGAGKDIQTVADKTQEAIDSKPTTKPIN